jgi:hypothetical protein
MDKHDDNSDDDELLGGDCDYVFMQEYKEKRIQREVSIFLHSRYDSLFAEMTQNEPSKRQAAPTVPSSVSLLHAPEFGACVNGGGEGWFIREVLVLHIRERSRNSLL